MRLYKQYTIQLVWLFLVFLSVMGMAKTACTEEVNLLVNGRFEECTQHELYPWNTPWPGFKGWFVRMAKNLNPKFGVVEDTVVEGKYSFRITKDLSGYLYIATNPAFDVSEFNGPYRISAYIKTREEEKHPLGSSISLVIWSWKKGGGNAYAFPIARVEGTTDWTQYSGVVNIRDMRFTSETTTWAVAIEAGSFSGDVWIDNIRLVR